MGGIWRQYARADARWAIRDTTVLSIELATVAVGLLCAIQIYGVYNRANWRHVLQIIICVAELYGGWMTFAPEWLDGSPNLNGSTFALLWIYLVFMNGLWVVIPVLLCWDSALKINQAIAITDISAIAGKRKKEESSPSSGTMIAIAGAGLSMFWWNIAAGFLVLYLILVPAVLSTATPVPAVKL